MSLEKKAVLVTGASRGIGRAIALRAALSGARVALNYASSDDRAKSLAEEIKRIGSEAVCFRADVSKMAEVESMVSGVLEAFGSLDVLVNNAGITRDSLLMRMREDDWDAVLNTNLKGMFNCTKAVSRQMLKQRSGRIINISSTVGITGNTGQANYSAAKAGVIGFTKSLAREFASRGITVNAVAPGFIQTDMTDALKEEVQKSILARIPLGKFGTPDDIAKTVVFLASDDAAYITGQTIVVDGGLAI